MKDEAIAHRIDTVIIELTISQRNFIKWVEKLPPVPRKNSRLDYIASESEVLLMQFKTAKETNSRALWKECSRRYAIWKVAFKAAVEKYGGTRRLAWQS